MRMLVMAAVALATAAAADAQTLVVARDVPRDPVSFQDSAYDVTVVRARSALEARQWERAAALWRSALEANDLIGEHWGDYGRALYHDGRPREAVAAFQRAMQLGGLSMGDGSLAVARAYACARNDKQAYRWLELALEAGYHARDAVSDDPAFSRYRSDRRFRDLANAIDSGARPSRSWPPPAAAALAT